MLKRIIFEPTYRCNLKCKMCIPFPEGKYKNKEMTYKEIEEIFLKSTILQDAELIDISGGEPFLRKDLTNIVELFLKNGLKVGITTNGWFTDRILELVDKVDAYKSKLFISISIDGLREKHDQIRGVKNSFDRALDSIKILKEYNIPVYINNVMQEDNYDTADELKKYFDELGASITFLPLAMFGKERFPYKDSEVHRILPYLNNEINVKYVLSKGKNKIKKCLAATNGCFIGADGTVFACLPTFREINKFDKFVLGNLIEENLDFDSLYIGAKAKKVRENVKKCFGCTKNCEVSREVRYNKFNTEITKKEILKYKKLLPSRLELEKMIGFNLIKGWHSIENNYLVWTKKEATIYLNLNKLQKVHIIKVKLVNAYPNCSIDDVFICDIFINGVMRKSIIFDKADMIVEESIEFKSSIHTKVCEITLRNNKEWIPDDYLKNGDRRFLGIGVMEICLEAIDK